jgi:hypothetical protein
MRRLVLAIGAIGAIGVSAVLAVAVSAAAAQTNVVPATTTHPVAVMTVSPSMVSVAGDGPNANCVANDPNGSSFTCTMHLHETAASTEPLTWAATTGNTGTAATFVPASGTLHPGQSVTVKAVALCDGLVAFIFLRSATGLLDNGAAVAYSCG